MRDEEIGGFRDAVAEDRRGLGGAHACHVNEALDGNGQPGQHSPLARGLPHQFLRMAPGAVETADGQRVDGSVNRFNPLLQRVEAIERRDLAALQGFHDFRCGACNQVRHFANPCFSMT